MMMGCLECLAAALLAVFLSAALPTSVVAASKLRLQGLALPKQLVAPLALAPFSPALAQQAVVPGFAPVQTWVLVLVGLVAPSAREGLVRRAALVVAGHMLDVAAPLALASQKSCQALCRCLREFGWAWWLRDGSGGRR